MRKRTWAEANSIDPNPASKVSPTFPLSADHTCDQPSNSERPRPLKILATSAASSPHSSDILALKTTTTRKGAAMNDAVNNDQQEHPSISRKVKACAACRKQKIKCLMDAGNAPPCRRCRERGLSCRLNKSLQTLMSEDSKWKTQVAHDISSVHASLQQVLQTLALPQLSDPHIFHGTSTLPLENGQEYRLENLDPDEHESYDDSPKMSPVAEAATQIPMESLYQITGLKSLHSAETVTEEQQRICKQLRDTDFVSRDQISLRDAEQLATYYLDHLDPYSFNMTAEYKSLEDFRRRSPTLTAAVLTVAALHDVAAKPEIYSLCGKEYKRLVANAMFERKIDMEYLRALVVGSFWLADIGWILSGYAIRRANEFHLKTCYNQIADSLKFPEKYSSGQLRDSRDSLRLLYLLYICDHHLSIFYGRASMMSDNESYITGFENYLASPMASDTDRRVAAQISLLILMSRIKESLSLEDSHTPLPLAMIPIIKNFERDLEIWVLRWSNMPGSSGSPGTFSMKATRVHYFFCKIYLDSHVFRGLSDICQGSALIPEAFVETASAAVEAATSVVNIILTDPEVQVGLAGVPHYFYGMIAFACVFLVKAAAKHGSQLHIDQKNIRILVERLSDQLSSTQVGHSHVIHRMAGGLQKMADSLAAEDGQSAKPTATDEFKCSLLQNDQDVTNSDTAALYARTLDQLSAADVVDFGLGDANMGIGMPFFDLEGTNPDLSNFMFSTYA